MQGSRSTRVNKFDAPAFDDVDTMRLNLNAVVKAFHTASAPQLSTIGMPVTSLPKSPSKDVGGDRKQFKILQECLKKQAVDTDSRYSQWLTRWRNWRVQ